MVLPVASFILKYLIRETVISLTDNEDWQIAVSVTDTLAL
jgi:hypothetical protein